MKTTQEIVKYIDNYMEWALSRPAMYASSPKCLEEILRCWVRLADFSLEM